MYSRVENIHPLSPLRFTKQGSEASLADILAAAAPELADGYKYLVNPLLYSGHTQTAYTALNTFAKYDHIHYKREIITVEDTSYAVDGESVKYDPWKGASTFAVDYVSDGSHDANHASHRPASQTDELPVRTEWAAPGNNAFPDDSRPLLVALHGLSGGSFESYVRSLLTETSKEGIDALVINSRGCANHTITSPQLFCGLWTNDLRYFVNEVIKKRWPNKKVFLIGFSLGGSIVANYLGQEKDEAYSNIKGAFIMGSPWDFTDASYVLRESLLGDRIYSPVMCQNLLKLLTKHYQGELGTNILVETYKKDPLTFTLNHLRDFDENFTCKLFGFNSSFEYYRHASPVQRMFKIRVPTLIVSSKDDPICGLRSLPSSEVKINPYTTLITTTVGGHLGWFDWRYNRWYPRPIARLISELAQWDVAPPAELPLDVDRIWRHDRFAYK